MSEEHLIEVLIAETWPRHYQLNPQEALGKIREKSSPGTWIYADNFLIDPEKVNGDDLSQVSTIRILAALVGGSTLSPQVGEEE